MDKAECKKQFYELVFPSLPNEWEVDQIIEGVAALPDRHQHLLLDQIPAIWPISHSLGLSFLEDGCRVIEAVPADLIPKWVRTILRSYEQEGLGGARRYILQAREYFLEPLKKLNMVRFEEVAKQMLFYLRGVSGEDLYLEKDPSAHTDTTTFYLPAQISLLSDYRHNRFLYKFLLSLHWGFHRRGTFKIRPVWKEWHLSPENAGGDQHACCEHLSLADYFSRFDSPELAKDIFFLLETGRVMNGLADDLPGLIRTFKSLQRELTKTLCEAPQNPITTRVTELGIFILFGTDAAPGWLRSLYQHRDDLVSPPGSVLSDLHEVYEQISRTPEPYHRPPLMDLLGKHNFEQANLEIERKRAEMKAVFILQLEALKQNAGDADEQNASQSSDTSGQTILVATENELNDNVRSAMTILDNPDVEIPAEFLELIEKIKDDLGYLPESYFSAASGAAGHGFSIKSPVGQVTGEPTDNYGGILFDEWDYRRNGYRKNWCTIIERQLPELHSTFVASTLEKHRGILLKLRRQFEMMKTSEHFIRRQREGDELDLDAIVEARGDQRAGISPSEKLFVRLQRNERDITTIFLVDMSNSTEGWVGTVIKEALVLLCEVMDVAGDPYGIIGFSGMRRSRCDLYRIKSIEEPYNQLIRQRISSILPREYTRMGPAVRYAVRQLKQCEARTRLLVTITDGKPEDYDDYKGEYAIEDTRKALQEARGCGIHSFGITVDREAHDYLPRMFGGGNYIFIDDIDKLPMRMIDMYRLLTV